MNPSEQMDSLAALDSVGPSSETMTPTGSARPKVPGYEIICELGRGCMGVVYEARQTSVGRSVALKTLTAQTNEACTMRLRTEAETIAKLRHPNIVQLYDYGEIDGRPYFSLEMVCGGTLEDLMQKQSLSPRQAAEQVETLARAMHSAHTRNIIHRDLKPANVLVDQDGSLKITDFGLAKRLQTGSGYTQAGEVFGTPCYMSPEQATGDLAQMGPPTDIYALGAILYEMLTGAPPHEADNLAATLHHICNREPAPIRNQNPNVHVDLETVCLKCLEKRPEDRYTSAADLADELRRFCDGQPVQVRPITSTERGMRWMNRHRVLSIVLGVIAVAFVAGLVLLLTIKSDADQAKHLVALAENELAADRALVLETPLGLTSFPIPSDNPLSEAKVELGKMLFFDKRLSVDDSISCADCHNPQAGWTVASTLAPGVNGLTNRNPPSIVNSAHQTFFFWDGRAHDFEEQALGPLLNPIEMGNPNAQFLEKKVQSIPDYVRRFGHVFHDGVTAINVSRAVAAYERTILAGNTPYDRFKANDSTAMSAAALRGMQLFFNKAHCSACHSGPYFSDGGFHNIGVGTHAVPFDAGREDVTGVSGDRGSFKTPTLRDVVRTAPYMHDGSIGTLAEVIDHYDGGGDGNPRQDEAIRKLGLTDDEKKDLLLFLTESLSSPDYPH